MTRPKAQPRSAASKGRRRPRRRPRQTLLLAGAVVIAVVVAAFYFFQPKPAQAPTRDFGPIPTSATGRDGALKIQVVRTDCGYENVISTETVGAEGHFCAVTLKASVRKRSVATIPFDLSCQFMVTDAHDRFAASEAATSVGLEPDSALVRGLAPGQKAQVEIYFDIPTDASPAALILHESCRSSGVRLSPGPTTKV